jgi:ribosomal-protein-alanine N-acetyltransferase
VLETERLVLSRLSALDAGFILALLNEPAFLRYIGDRGVRDEADARRYVEAGPVASYARFGFGLYRVGLKPAGEPIGICGLLKRDALEDPDIGFALLARHRSRGYAHEAAAAVLAHARTDLGLRRLLAITSPDNEVSIGLLERLGFRFERLARMAPDAPEVKVFAREL